MAITTERQMGAAGIALLTLATGQFLMTLDSSVMNVSIATVSHDLGTTVTGIQTAITLYTLVMAALMITGGALGQMFGRKRAFALGCIIYGCGSLVTAISPNLGVLIAGWSFLEGIGAALILPAIVAPKPGAPTWLGLSPAIWMILAGGLLVWLFLQWESHLLARGRRSLIDLSILRVRTLRAGLTSFFFQYLIQMGMFFAIPLFLSVALGLSAIATGVRLLPLSITLLLAAAGIPRVFPNASPRRVAQLGFAALFAGLIVLVGALDAGAGPEVVTWPMLLAGLGVGALASQLGSITVSSVSDEHSGEVGGLQNTLTNLGASIGTALTGAVLIAALSSSFLTGIQNNPAVPAQVKSQASTKLAGGAPFISDAQLRSGLEQAGIGPEASEAIVQENESARIDGLRSAMSALAALALIALLLSRGIPAVQPAARAG